MAKITEGTIVFKGYQTWFRPVGAGEAGEIPLPVKEEYDRMPSGLFCRGLILSMLKSVMPITGLWKNSWLNRKRCRRTHP